MTRPAKIFILVLAVLVTAVGAVYLGTRIAERAPSDSPEPSPLVTVTESPPLSDSTVEPAPDSEPATPSPQTRTSQDVTLWNGPDDAVATWFSESCQREVLRFGVQQYTPGRSVDDVPPHISYLGYHLGDRRLYGDRGAPGELYVSADEGQTFQEWLATDQMC